jgi:hypothetical protein
MKTMQVVASEEVKVGRCFGLLKQVVVSDEDKAGRCFSQGGMKALPMS